MEELRNPVTDPVPGDVLCKRNALRKVHRVLSGTVVWLPGGSEQQQRSSVSAWRDWAREAKLVRRGAVESLAETLVPATQLVGVHDPD